MAYRKNAEKICKMKFLFFKDTESSYSKEWEVILIDSKDNYEFWISNKESNVAVRYGEFSKKHFTENEIMQEVINVIEKHYDDLIW